MVKRILGLVAIAALTFTAFDAAATADTTAESTAVVVIGKADAHARTIISTAFVSTMQGASWAVLDQPLPMKDSEAIARCMSEDRPWPCIAPIADGRGVSRVAVVQVDPERVGDDTRVVVVAQLVLKGDDVPSVGRRVCNRCSDTEMARSAVGLATDLIQDAQAGGLRTMIAVHTEPAGATITIDGTVVGASDRKIGTHAGKHTVMLQLSGYATTIDEINASEGQTAVVSRRLEREDHTVDNPRDDSHPYRWPVALTVAGAAVAGTGAIIYFASGPSGERPQYRDWRPLGGTLGILGAGVIAYGIYKLVDASNAVQSSSGPTVGLFGHGGFVAWGGAF